MAKLLVYLESPIPLDLAKCSVWLESAIPLNASVSLKKIIRLDATLWLNPQFAGSLLAGCSSLAKFSASL